MIFRNNIIQLEDAFKVLNQQSLSTSEMWNDPVKKKFYEQFIDSLPTEINECISILYNIDSTFEKAEQIINDLSNNI